MQRGGYPAWLNRKTSKANKCQKREGIVPRELNEVLKSAVVQKY